MIEIWIFYCIFISILLYLSQFLCELCQIESECGSPSSYSLLRQHFTRKVKAIHWQYYSLRQQKTEAFTDSGFARSRDPTDSNNKPGWPFSFLPLAVMLLPDGVGQFLKANLEVISLHGRKIYLFMSSQKKYLTPTSKNSNPVRQSPDTADSANARLFRKQQIDQLIPVSQLYTRMFPSYSHTDSKIPRNHMYDAGSTLCMRPLDEKRNRPIQLKPRNSVAKSVHNPVSPRSSISIMNDSKGIQGKKQQGSWDRRSSSNSKKKAKYLTVISRMPMSKKLLINSEIFDPHARGYLPQHYF